MTLLKTLMLSAVGAAALVTAGTASADTYTVNFNVGVGGVTGTIDTDGTLGILADANITDYSLLLNDGSSTFLLNGTANSGYTIIGNGFTATAGGLFFDFGGLNTAIDFQNPSVGSGINFFCLNATGTTCTGGGPGSYLRIDGDTLSDTYQGVVQIAVGGGAIPEPATWAMMIGGFGLVGGAMRRRSTRIAYA